MSPIETSLHHSFPGCTRDEHRSIVAACTAWPFASEDHICGQIEMMACQANGYEQAMYMAWGQISLGMSIAATHHADVSRELGSDDMTTGGSDGR